MNKNVWSTASPKYQHLQNYFELAKPPAKALWNGANEGPGNGAEEKILNNETSWCASVLDSPSWSYAQKRRSSNKNVGIKGGQIAFEMISCRLMFLCVLYPVLFWAGQDWGFPWCCLKLTLYVPGELVVGVADCWVWRIMPVQCRWWVQWGNQVL